MQQNYDFVFITCFEFNMIILNSLQEKEWTTFHVWQEICWKFLLSIHALNDLHDIV